MGYSREDWEKELSRVRALPEEKWQKAASFLRQELLGLTWDEKQNETALEGLETLMLRKDEDVWVTRIVNPGSTCPIPFHSLGGGMTVRNILREGGFHEEYFDDINLDYIYFGVAELAVLGHRITKDETDQWL